MRRPTVVAMRTGAHLFRTLIDETFRALVWRNRVKHRFGLFALTDRRPG